MRITTSENKRLAKTPLVVLFVTQGAKPALPAGVEPPPAFLSGFSGEARRTRETYCGAGPAQQLLLVGLGARDAVDAEGLRRASAVAVKRAEELGVAKATCWVDGGTADLLADPERAGRALAEGARMGAYRYVDQKSAPPDASCKALAIAGPTGAFQRGVRRGVVLAEANCFARDLQNRPANLLRPRDMASAAKKLAASSPRITCKVLDEKAMKELGMGLLLGVSQGSTEPARLVHLVYRPRAKARSRVALVGKGLTFDSGGISIKPAAKMDEMRYDMSGGAAVLGAFHALARLDVPHEVHGIVGCTENLIDGNATKPGDVHVGMDGTTVEVLNTDAEGRLVLADCLTYAQKKVKPDTILDLATLTGAVIIALGHELTGIFPTSDGLRDALLAAGEATGERCWPLPLLEVHKEAMKGKVADLANIGSPAVGAGSTQGAAFLSRFVADDVEWCHMDIAGTAWSSVARDWVGGAQGSGVGARLLIEYLENRR
jgi:leucyl aminopeptidase